MTEHTSRIPAVLNDPFLNPARWPGFQGPASQYVVDDTAGPGASKRTAATTTSSSWALACQDQHCADELARRRPACAVVERELAGGGCSYFACMLSKTPSRLWVAACSKAQLPRRLGGLPAVKASALTRVSSWYGERF